MEADEFSFITNPDAMNAETLYSLRSLVSRYPYYQTARLLMVKNLLSEKNADFGKELRNASLFAADRSVLYYMVEGNRYRLDALRKKRDVVEAKPVVEKQPGRDRTADLIDDYLVAMPDDVPQRRLTLADATTDYAAYLAQQDYEEEQRTQTARTAAPAASKRPVWNPDYVAPIPDYFGDETESDDDELGAAPKKSISEISSDVRRLEAENPNPVGEKEDDDAAPQLALKTNEENVFTETLAKIYIKQGKYSRAIEIMRRLKADYPKKSSYFADQIRFLEKIVINNKNKK